jgi:hypothetical protein
VSRDVFISYKTEDREAAERLCAALERENISCWLAPRDIPLGKEWAASIVDALQKCKNFVLLLSANSVAAKQIAREAELADKQNLPILTFRLDDIQPPNELLYFLGNVQWVDAFGGQFDSAAARLAAVIRAGAVNPAPKTTTAPAATMPLPILVPPSAAKPSYLFPIAGGAVALIAVVLWFALHKSTPPEPQPNPGDTKAGEVQEVKNFADQYLKYRDSGDYAAAWAQYSNGFHNRNSEAAWESDTDKRNRSHGGVTQHDYQHCRANESAIYQCVYTLVYKDGSKYKNELRVVKNPSGSGWLIDTGKVSQTD